MIRIIHIFILLLFFVTTNILSLHPDFVDCYYFRSNLEGKIKDIQGVKEDLRHAVNIDKNQNNCQQ